MNHYKLRDAILGFMVGDALGVPYEFKERDTFKCVGMVGHGTHDQPAGTWSDDTSMTLATLYSLHTIGKIDLNDIMHQFCDWWYENEFINSDEPFDIGYTTNEAINKYRKRTPIEFCGSNSINSNGNGSLMRILPLAFIDCNWKDIANVSSLTHAHPIAIEACQIYWLIAKELLQGVNILKAIKNVCTNNIWRSEYNRLSTIESLNRNEISSSGYVVDTLESALWCLVKTDNYKDCVLTAVNLGNDTDTVAAVAGGLAGIIYGEKDIPEKWIKTIKSRCL